MNQHHVHWKKVASDPNYLGEGDFVEGEEKIVTLDHINETETIKTTDGKEVKAVCYWKERDIKPMILNVARAKAMAKVVGDDYIDRWVGHRFTLYIEQGIKAFGAIVAAVRVRPVPPVDIPPCAKCGGPIKALDATRNALWVAEYTKKNLGAPHCMRCARAVAEARKKEEEKNNEGEEKPDSQTAAVHDDSGTTAV